ncbi:MAG: hypothetical protein ABI642_09645 [Polaromonas sp.]
MVAHILLDESPTPHEAPEPIASGIVLLRAGLDFQSHGLRLH